MSKKKREPVDPEHLKPEDRMKFEIAKELGLADKVIAGGWRCLTAKESGRIGGLVTKKEERNVRKNAGQGEFRGKLPLKQWRFSFIIRGERGSSSTIWKNQILEGNQL